MPTSIGVIFMDIVTVKMYTNSSSSFQMFSDLPASQIVAQHKVKEETEPEIKSIPIQAFTRFSTGVKLVSTVHDLYYVQFWFQYSGPKCCKLLSIFLVLSHTFGYLEQKLLDRLWKSLFFLKSNFYVSEKFWGSICDPFSNKNLLSYILS
jgi:hypothetical protein